MVGNAEPDQSNSSKAWPITRIATTDARAANNRLMPIDMTQNLRTHHTLELTLSGKTRRASP